jgi:hypothetical protein
LLRQWNNGLQQGLEQSEKSEAIALSLSYNPYVLDFNKFGSISNEKRELKIEALENFFKKLINDNLYILSKKDIFKQKTGRI